MTVYPTRTMGTKCPICNRDISQQEVLYDYPNLCTACANHERELKTRRQDGRTIPPDQKTLW